MAKVQKGQPQADIRLSAPVQIQISGIIMNIHIQPILCHPNHMHPHLPLKAMVVGLLIQKHEQSENIQE